MSYLPRCCNLQSDESVTLVACAGGSLELVQWLLSVYSGDLNLPSGSGETPFWEACFYGHLSVAKWLAVNGATVDLNYVDKVRGDCGGGVGICGGTTCAGRAVRQQPARVRLLGRLPSCCEVAD